MRYISIILLVVNGCLFSLHGRAQANTDSTLTALIIDGFSNHNWQQTTHLTKHILESSGRFQVSIFTLVPEEGNSQHRPTLTDYDVVIQNTNNIQDTTLRWPPALERALEDYVRQGGGLYILHSANNAFSKWPEYNRMIGMGWRSKAYGTALAYDSTKKPSSFPPGEGKGTNHGDRYDALIEQLNVHPIHRDFPTQWVTANMELYEYARGPAENTTVLSVSFDPEKKIYWPVEWVIEYGKGRVYNSSMGHLWKDEHIPPAYRCVGFQTVMIRAAEWLATGNVHYPVPANFPSSDRVSLQSMEYFDE